MHRVIVVGSGPAAAGCILGLQDREDLEITVLDVGERLPPANEMVAEKLRSVSLENWPEEERAYVSTSPHGVRVDALPEKTVLGSNYPFADFGQLSGVRWRDTASVKVISGAMGGFSNIWGAQAYPFTPRTLSAWPDGGRSMDLAYRNVVATIPFAGRSDALESFLPLHGTPSRLPPLARRIEILLMAAEKAEEQLWRRNIVVGTSRVAIASEECVVCGLCNSGCVWDLIFSTRQMFDSWRLHGRIKYHPHLLVTSVGETAEGTEVHAVARDGSIHRFFADQVFLGAGAFGTTRIVLNSLPTSPVVTMLETRLVVVPLWSNQAVPDPQRERTFAVGQAGILISPGTVNESFVQLYPYDSSFAQALPIAARKWAWLRTSILKHISVGLLLLNSDQSPTMTAYVEARRPGEIQGELVIKAQSSKSVRRDARRTIGQLASARRYLDLWPIWPAVRVAAPGRSYHWGGSFPYAPNATVGLTSDRLGRVEPWRRIHLIDASVFPHLAPTGFLLTVMANANRIAVESLEAGE